ncbi:hypothetical protein ABBQ38_012303 [Trebouxia sp. C0009 RCD-2024]
MAPEIKVPCFAFKDKSAQLERWEFEPAPLRAGDIEIRVTHNGLCHSDVHVGKSEWGPVKYPMVPGHEIVGVVEQLGSTVTHLNKGDIVGFGWNKDCCQHCDACITGNDNVCPEAAATIVGGGENHGGFAEKFRGSANLAFKIPEAIEPAEAAPLLCAGITVWSAIKRYVTRPGMKVGVVGLGGLGHLAIHFLAKAVGAEVYAISHSPSKEEEAKNLGAAHFVGVEDIEDNSLDVVMNTTTGGMDAKQLLKKVGFNGTLVYVGGGLDTIKIMAMDLILAQKQVVGSCVGGRAQMREMFHLAALHNIKPILDTMPLEQCKQAVDKLMAGKARYRIVLETGDAFGKSNL